MALRKATAYSKKYARPYTRKSKVRQRSYIKAVPNPKIIKFRMGNLEAYAQGKYTIILKVISKEDIQIRDNSLEAVRQYLNRFLNKATNKEYYFEIKNYPHHILRENKMLCGAGADRMQTGMSHSFGKAIGRAAFLKKGQTLIIIGVLNPKHESEARKLINSAKPKLPCKVHIDTIRKQKI